MKKEIPARVRLRPDPAQWSPDELMSLPEAAALFFPSGLLTTASLRTSYKNKQLAVAVIARRHLTTRASVEAMARDSLRVLDDRPAAPAARPGWNPDGC